MNPRGKKRLDVLLVERGHFSSREKARSAIMTGEVMVEGHPVLKPGTAVNSNITLEVRSLRPAYVSRGGHKLEKALEEFAMDLSGKTILDVGASTGGFTQCALKGGARRVYAVDVGYGQLDWSLRQDPRVVNMERCNVRYLKKEDLKGDRIDLALVDVSFISLALVFPVLVHLEIPRVLALVKPQFEAGRDQVGKGGVVRDPRVHREVLEAVAQKAAGEGYVLHHLTHSPLRGPKGNIEFLAYFSREEPSKDPPSPAKIVSTAHESLVK